MVAEDSGRAGGWGRFTVVVIAVAIVSAAQAVTYTSPWLSLAGFALGMLLFLLSVRRTQPKPEAEASAPQKISRIFWVLFVLGSVTCGLAGFAVYYDFSIAVTHRLWFAGLGLLVLSTVASVPGIRLALPSRRAMVACVLLLTVSTPAP